VSITSNAPFTASRNGLRQFTVVAGTGTATLQAQAGDNWVDVQDGILAVDGIITFYAVSDQMFRITLTGDAEAWLTG